MPSDSGIVQREGRRTINYPPALPGENYSGEFKFCRVGFNAFTATSNS